MLVFKQTLAQVLLTRVIFVSDSHVNVVRCFQLNKDPLLSFSIMVCFSDQDPQWQLGSLSDHSRRVYRDHVVLHDNDNNRGEAAVEYRWLCVNTH